MKHDVVIENNAHINQVEGHRIMQYLLRSLNSSSDNKGRPVEHFLGLSPLLSILLNLSHQKKRRSNEATVHSQHNIPKLSLQQLPGRRWNHTDRSFEPEHISTFV